MRENDSVRKLWSAVDAFVGIFILVCKCKMSLVSLLLTFFLAQPLVSAFPMGKCPNKQCISSPLSLYWTTVQTGQFCFETAPTNCTNIPPMNCCDYFQTLLNKFVFSIDPRCMKNVTQVTIDGVKKGGGVYTVALNTSAELHLTDLQWNTNSAANHKICIYTTGEVCSNLQTFCTDGTGRCRFSVYDAIKHICCPSCDMNIPSIPTQYPISGFNSSPALALNISPPTMHISVHKPAPPPPSPSPSFDTGSPVTSDIPESPPSHDSYSSPPYLPYYPLSQPQSPSQSESTPSPPPLNGQPSSPGRSASSPPPPLNIPYLPYAPQNLPREPYMPKSPLSPCVSASPPQLIPCFQQQGQQCSCVCESIP